MAVYNPQNNYSALTGNDTTLYSNFQKEEDRRRKLGIDYVKTGFEPTEPAMEQEEVDDDDYMAQGMVERTAKGAAKFAKTSRISKRGDKSMFSGGEGLTMESGLAVGKAAFDIGKSFTEVSGSQKESWGQTLNQTAQGAQAGMMVGGPIGAAIGGGIGLVTGVVDMFGDMKKRNEAEIKSTNEKFEQIDTKRELQYAMDTKQKNLDKLIELRKSQLNYINPKY